MKTQASPPASRPAGDPRPLETPVDIEVGADGTVFVLDSGHGRVLTAAGPTAREWNVLASDPAWVGASGIGLAADGTVWVASTRSHRVIGVEPSGRRIEVGGYGARADALVSPRDVAVGPTDGRLYVADGGNQRLAVFNPEGSIYRSLGGGALMARPQRVAFDRLGRPSAGGLRLRAADLLGRAGSKSR